MFDFDIFVVRCAVGAIGACAVSKRVGGARVGIALTIGLLKADYMRVFDELQCPILVARAQHRPMFSARRCSASSLPLTHVGVIIFCHNIAYEVPLLGNVVWRDAHRCWKWLSRFGVPASCRPSIAPPVRGGAAVVCANIHYDVLLLIIVVWRDARSCRTMSIRFGARCTSDHRSRLPCTVVPPSCAPRLPTMYQY
jgi:hypothetical protein